jgi:hypothetical protein
MVGFWRFGVFRLVAALCAVFFVLTLLAMLAYPGGSIADPHAAGYAFFDNFFSDLGQTHIRSGASNAASLVLFCVALVGMAFGLALFFIAFAQFFARSRAGRVLGFVGIGAGLVTAVCFTGVAATPWNLYLQAHNDFVTWAFRAYLLAVLAFVGAIFATPEVPRRFAYVFIAFAVVLVAYVVLLTAGPTLATSEGARIQVVGQKVIVYASIATIMIQSLGVRKPA